MKHINIRTTSEVAQKRIKEANEWEERRVREWRELKELLKTCPNCGSKRIKKHQCARLWGIKEIMYYECKKCKTEYDITN